jgi:glutamate-1-semialdehyde 2,1-aminomutase
MTNNESLLDRAVRVIPGGVNSPVRAFRAVGALPRFIARGEGARVWDVEGKEYLDYLGSWGPLILGHAPPAVVGAVTRAAGRGTSFGAATEAEVQLAEAIVEAVPSIEVVRLVNSGTEATMSAVRLARAFTGREKIVKFDGHYHGHADTLLVQAGSGVLTLGLPDSPGVPAGVAAGTLSLPFNDAVALEAAFTQFGKEIAAVILEPVAANMGVIPPAPGFLAVARGLTLRHDALLIFDEVITGFRLAYGGAQEVYNVLPDLTCLGKVIGGGLPVGAYGGRADIMALVAPAGPVYQAGTLSGNPLATAAGLATLEALSAPVVYSELERKAAALAEGLAAAARGAGVSAQVNRVGSLLTAFFTDGPVTDLASAKRSDTARYAAFFRAMLDRGVYLAPSQFEAAFVSLAHTDADIAATIAAANEAFATLAG